MKLDRGEVPTRLAPNSHMTRITSHIAPPNTCLQKAWRRFYSSEVRNHLRLFSGKVLDTYSVVEMQCNKQFCKNVITLDMTQFYLCYNFFLYVNCQHGYSVESQTFSIYALYRLLKFLEVTTDCSYGFYNRIHQ